MAVGKKVAVFTLFRLVLPLSLFGATIVRYNGFSLVYGCLMLVAPLLPRPSPLSMKSHTGRYLVAVVALCSTMLLAQIVFQGYLLGVASEEQPYGTILPNCSMLERSLRQLGLQRLEPNDFGNILRIVLPDIGMFIISLFVFLLCRKICPPPEAHPRLGRSISQVRERIYRHTTSLINFAGELVVAVLLAASGIMCPCMLSAVYFLAFLAIATWWACYQRLGKRFAIIRVLLLVYSATHLLAEYLYQMQFFQEKLHPQTLAARILGLNAIVWTDCRKPWLLQFYSGVKWYVYASPGVILLLYYILACETRRWIRTLKRRPLYNMSSPGMRGEAARRHLEQGEGESQVDGAAEAKQALVGGDVTSPGPNYHSITEVDLSSLAPDDYGGSNHNRESGARQAGAGPDQPDGARTGPEALIGVRSPIVSIFVYAMKQSYVATLIIMMAWSITYHSWLTFVYLLAACIIWMIPAKRSVCLLASPLIVCYTEALLTLNYIYGLNLTDEELPNPDDYRLDEIGLVKYDYPCVQLAIQIAFTLAFWLTLRQHMREVHLRRQEFYMQGLTLEVVPSQSDHLQQDPASATSPTSATSPGGATTQGEADNSKPYIRAEDLVDGFDSENMKKLGWWIWHMCCKYWIFVCAAMFLVMAVLDSVIYRIVYMVLFLYFIITFQLFYKWWRISIYVFWWIVIEYSMVVLCLIYTYQFDQIRGYWNQTGISEAVLRDLGLMQFSTSTLFAKLLTPTSFLIVIILQVHYFQRPFNKLSDIYALVKRPGEEELKLYRAEAEGGAVRYSDTDPSPTASGGCAEGCGGVAEACGGVAEGNATNNAGGCVSTSLAEEEAGEAERPHSACSQRSNHLQQQQQQQQQQRKSRSHEALHHHDIEDVLVPASTAATAPSPTLSRGSRPRSGLYQDTGLNVTHDTIHTQAESRKPSWKERIVSLTKRAYKQGEQMLNRFSALIWRLLEIHIFKAVAFTIFLCSVEEVCAINVLFVLLLLVGTAIPPARQVVSNLCQVWACMVILAKMIYQLRLVQEEGLLTNCTTVKHYPVNTTLVPPWSETVNNANWFGLHKTDNLAKYLMNYLAISVLLAFEAVIRIHQEQYFKPAARVPPRPGIVFPEVTRDNADKNLLQCAKFFLNYTFYKFGLEICFITTMLTMVVRLDVYSVIYGLFLGLLLTLPRLKCYYVWPVYIFVLLLLLFLQYLDCLGVPPGLCWDYPWNQFDTLKNNLKIYLYLPDFQDPPNPLKLLPDFFQLLFACLEMTVLRLENSPDAASYGGGSNDGNRAVDKIDPKDSPSDFLSCKDSYLDYIKTVVFLYMYWGTLIIVFVAGTTRISLFCMGYLVGCFFFLWFGQELLVKPLEKLLRLWGILLGYNYLVILLKSCLQLVGCVYLSDVSASICWIVQLFSIVCLRAGNYQQDEISQEGCNLDEDEAGLTWDAICFVFLLLQLRIYKSHYFMHVVNELEIQNKLSARGAELINTNLIRRVEQQKVREEEVLESIKRKMERIKERQARLNKNMAKDFRLHYHENMIRSGDYYMFEDDSDEDSESIDQVDKVEPGPKEESDDEDKTPKVDPFQIINTVLKEGTREALNVAERQLVDRRNKTSHSESESDAGSRRDSVRLSGDMDSPVRDTMSPTSPVATRHSHFSAEFQLDAARKELESIREVKDEDLSRKSHDDSPETSTRVLISSVDPEIQVLTMATGGGPGDPESGDSGDSDSEAEEDEEKEPVCTKISNSLRLLWAVIGGFIDYLIGVLHDISREYRSVSRILDHEKEAEKKRVRDGQRKAYERYRRPDVSRVAVPSTSSARVHVHRRQKTRTEIILDIDETERERFDLSLSALRSAEKEFHSRMPRLLQLCMALLEALMSRSEFVCYFAMILNHMVSASLLSLAYPLTVFLWAMLSVPRPTKTYWVTIITYTEAVIVVKFLFQFGFFPWNDGTVPDSPFWPPSIIGIEKRPRYAAYDLVLLFCLFIHRTVLKRHGLWKDATDIEMDMAKAERDVASRPQSPRLTPQEEALPTISFTTTVDTDLTPLQNSLNSYHDDTLETSLETAGAAAQSRRHRKRGARRSLGMVKSCLKPFSDFYIQMTNPKYNAVADVYAYMFACDFIAFIVIVFGYSSFGPAESVVAGSETVTSVISENKVPVPFLVMLLASFVLFIVDRALFLRKNVLGKFAFQILLVAVVHAWMFFVLPAVTDRKFTDNTPAQLWYFVKCIYFGLSAYQIRSGYPTRILGNFLTKHFNYLNLFLFKGFLIIPFLLELRALMDWMWTDTTLAITSWLQMEDIFANVFILKCWRRSEQDYPFERGTKRRAIVKYGMGGLLLLVLIFIIWFPLLLFSLANTVYVPNPPLECQLRIKLGGFQPLFDMNAQQANLHPVNSSAYNRLREAYSKDPPALSFLSSYKEEDIYMAEIPGESTSVWGISPPSETELVQLLRGNDTINMVVTTTFMREPTQSASESVSESVSNVFIKELRWLEDRALRDNISDMIISANGSVMIPYLFPRYLRVPGKGKVEQVDRLNDTQANVTLFLRREENTSKLWWEVQQVASADPFTEPAPSPLPGPSAPNPTTAPGSSRPPDNSIVIISFNDRVAPGAFSFFTSYGIIGLYISFILVIGRFIRLMTSGLAQNIMFTHLPYVDRVLKLCRDLYLVREAKELRLEEELFARLVFLYRSPETLIKETRHPEIKVKED